MLIMIAFGPFRTKPLKYFVQGSPMPKNILLLFYIVFLYYVKRNHLILCCYVNKLIDKQCAMRYNCRCGTVQNFEIHLTAHRRKSHCRSP